MKSSLKNMVICLLLITLGAAVFVGVAHGLTQEPIATAKKLRAIGALSLVMPEFDNNPAQDSVTVEVDGIPITVWTGRKGETVTGYAVETVTKAGYSGEIRMMVGFLPDGTIHNIEVLRHNETPGLGSAIADPDNPLLTSFVGRKPSELKMSVRNEGGDIDAITASTISSRAYIDAVQRAYDALLIVTSGETAVKIDYIEAAVGEYQKMLASIEVEMEGIPIIVNVIRKKDGEIVHAVQTESQKGYKGTIRLMVGFFADGTIHDIAVMEHNETQGFGAAIDDPKNPLLMSFKGKNANDIKFALKVDKGDVDAISGSTVTSRAYVEAVKRAYMAWVSVKTSIGQRY